MSAEKEAPAMSEPFIFAFDRVNASTDIIHCVVFTSLKISHYQDSGFKRVARDLEPRMDLLLDYLWDQYIEQMKKKLIAQMKANNDGSEEHHIVNLLRSNPGLRDCEFMDIMRTVYKEKERKRQCEHQTSSALTGTDSNQS